ncbi:hypothetical protein NB697_003512 [Xanthomonas sacchari]|uniref:hypothetical protein n=1 Tax=Xanthomonas sacchari TaxID=56458 RepID=UPI0022562C54|nr:hypothetical protein [Xanthomonas sacchari]MCW0380666.1 hypothetical protein [Xanthomonas sacchari]
MKNIAPANPQLQLLPVREVEIDGVQMGVLSDGTPYLTARGLALMCGIDNSVLIRMANNWAEESTKPRGRKISTLLANQGYTGSSLYLRTHSKGVETHAYPDAVCMALLEYYAFEADQGSNDVAVRNFRLLARSSIRAFIYNRCGYDPQKVIPEAWKNYHERILLNDQVPVGYFSVFREIADIVVHMIQAECPIDEHTVPDLSVGIAWSKHWQTVNGEQAYGGRLKHPHFFPEWFPQAAVNPVDAWIYPLSALGTFRIWLYENYLPKSFPRYVEGKVKKGLFLPSGAEILISAVKKPLQLDN